MYVTLEMEYGIQKAVDGENINSDGTARLTSSDYLTNAYR